MRGFTTAVCAVVAALTVAVTPALAATSGLLAFQSMEPGGRDTVKTVNPVTGTLTAPDATPGPGAPTTAPPALAPGPLAVPGILTSRDSANPAWSPDGTRLAYSSTAVDAPTNIYVVNAGAAINNQAPVPQQVTFDPVAAIDPTWSPDGQQIAYTGFVNGDANIFVVDLRSGAVVQLTTERSADQQADWSPDGATIAFHSDRARSGDIWLMSRDGSNQRQLTSDPGDEADAEWNPAGGTHIAYSASAAATAGRDIYSIRATGGVAQRLTRSVFVWNMFPAWSPDGKHIAYAQDNYRVLVMPAAGSDVPSPGIEQARAATDPDWAVLPLPAATAKGDVTVKRPGSAATEAPPGEPVRLTKGTIVDTTGGGELTVTVNRPAASVASPDSVTTVEDAVVRVIERTPESLGLRIERPEDCPTSNAPARAAKAKPQKARARTRTKKGGKGPKRAEVRPSSREAHMSSRDTDYDVVVTCNGTYVRVREGLVFVTPTGRPPHRVKAGRQLFLPRKR